MMIRSNSALLRASVLGCSLVIVIALSWACREPRGPEAGAVVVRCESGRAAAGAGLEVGDTIIHWRRGDLGGPIDSSFDLALVEQREAPAGPVELTFRRGRRELQTVVQTGVWRVESRPVLSPGVLSRLRRAEDHVTDEEIEAAIVALDAIAGQLGEAEKVEGSAWVDLQLAVVLYLGDRPQEARDRLQRAAQAIPDRLDRAVFWERTGHRLLKASRLPPAAEALQTAQDLHRGLGTEGPLVAHLLIQQCRANLRKCGPEARKALVIYREAHGENMEVAEALKVNGTTAYFRSEWDAAEEDYRQGLSIVRRLAPESPAICDFLGNLGLIAFKKGDFDTARRLFREDLSEAERLGSPPEQMGYAANYLGLVAKSLGQYEEARSSYLQALEAFRSFRPGGVEEAGILTNLGNVALREEDYRSASVYHRQALGLREQINPGGADVAASLHNLGVSLRRSGRYDDAGPPLERALEIKQTLAPQSGWLANTLLELGEVARSRGRFDDADGLFREALEIRLRVAPGHPQVAESLFLLGLVRFETGRPAEAEEMWRRALAIIEDCRSRMGLSDEERAQFAGSFFGFYRAMAGLLVDQGRAVEAFDVIERGRTGALCAMLMDQNQVPPGVSTELWFSKTRTEGRIRRIEAQRARISLRENAERLEQLNENLRILRDQYMMLLEKIGVSSPRFKTFGRPQPLRFRDVATVADTGTILLSYVVGKDRSLVMTVTVDADGRASLKASVLPVGADELSLKVDIFRALINRGKSGALLEPALRDQAERLFRVLIEPCRDDIESADRVLILPDGPLLDLPFAALIDPENGVFLGQWKALVFNPSAGVVAALKGLRTTQSRPQPKLVAFGDPLVSPGEGLEKPKGLGPLPGSRSEVENIAQIFGKDATVFLGADATEAAVRDVTPGATFVHFAVHALADRRTPMESALFLSAGNGGRDDSGDDGVLKAFEIMNEMVIDAEVVTLSACGTAGGREVPGEGIVGLARAFQFAGARSVVVTQWPVSDQSAASLMSGFYDRLERGVGPAEALRGAQNDQLMLGGTSTHPFHWAAFQVMGDPR
ncbi:MAG: CHAT domain-containing protein [Acidobacteriota bacterium]